MYKIYIFFLEQYIIQKPFPVLCGRCVFVGTLYPINSEESIDIRMEYAISGPEESHVSLCFYSALKLAKPIHDKVVLIPKHKENYTRVARSYNSNYMNR